MRSLISENKKGKYTLSIFKTIGGFQYRIDNQWNSDYPIFYPHNKKIAYDNPEWWPKYIKAWLERLIRAFEAERGAW